MTKIDWDKPIELSDGTPIDRVVNEGHWYSVYIKGQMRLFRPNGTCLNEDRYNTHSWAAAGRTVRNVVPEPTDQELADKYRELVEERLKLRNELFERGYSIYYDGKKVASVGDVAKYDFRKTIEVKI